MKYLSVCSGLEAASVAWAPLNWSPVAFSEIGDFPSRVLTHHYPDVPNFGDMTKFKEWPHATVNLLVGGTPCQSFSVTGLRAGLDDPRGNLCLTYLAIADRYRPDWIVWENVPGVLSSGQGRDFGAFLGGLGQLGYGFAYRVLDAQYIRVDGFDRAVPQRRRRVFVVGCLGGWRCAASVLFEQESMFSNPAPSRTAGEGTAARSKRGSGKTVYSLEPHVKQPDGLLTNVAYTLRAQRRPVIIDDFGARRLTPIECERLQGFPDGYTDLSECLESDRYMALGNSMAVNVMRWVGRRIECVNQSLEGASQ